MSRSAFSVLLGRIVYIDRYIDVPKKSILDTFLCPYHECAAPMTVASNMSENLRQPYFRSSKSKPHVDDCPLSKKNQNSDSEPSDDSPSTLPSGCPVALKLSNVSDTETTTDTKTEDSEHSNDGFLGPAYDTEEKRYSGPPLSFPNRDCTAYQLSQVVRWFVQNPEKGDRELKVPGCSESTYSDIFAGINSTSSPNRSVVRIFQARIFIEDPFVDNENPNCADLNLALFNEFGETVAGGKIIFDSASWGESKSKRVGLIRKMVEQTLELQRKKHYEVFRVGGRTPFRAFVFFLGRERRDEPLCFDVLGTDDAFYSFAGPQPPWKIQYYTRYLKRVERVQAKTELVESSEDSLPAHVPMSVDLVEEVASPTIEVPEVGTGYLSSRASESHEVAKDKEESVDLIHSAGEELDSLEELPATILSSGKSTEGKQPEKKRSGFRGLVRKLLRRKKK